MDSTTLKREIGNRIHEYRISKGMTQAQFSECINISVNFLSELENGKKGLSSETLYNICNEFSVSADYPWKITKQSRLFPSDRTN